MPIKWNVDTSDDNFVIVGQWEDDGGLIGQWGPDVGAIIAVQPGMQGIPIGENVDGSSIYPDDVAEESRKGKLGLVCAHPLCSCHPARWLANEPDGFGLAGVYYCDGCATDINRRVSTMHPDRAPACQKV